MLSCLHKLTEKLEPNYRIQSKTLIIVYIVKIHVLRKKIFHLPLKIRMSKFQEYQNISDLLIHF